MSPMALVSWSKVVAPLRRRWDFNVETATRLVRRVRKTVWGTVFGDAVVGRIGGQDQHPAAPLLQGGDGARAFVGGAIVEMRRVRK